MRRAMRDTNMMRAVVTIRNLQAQAAQLACARADRERRLAGERLEEGRVATRAAELGWASTLDNPVFDPGLSCFWLRDLAARQEEERALDEAASRTGEEAGIRRRALQVAQALSDAAAVQARALTRTAARQRDEARLAAVEDRFNARRQRP